MSEIVFEYDNEKIIVGSENWKEWVLSSDPFDGDMDDSPTLSDKVVKARKTIQLCSDCLSICKSGTFNRLITMSIDGVLQTNRYCQDCCTASAFPELHHDFQQYDEDSEEYPETSLMLYEVRQNLRVKNEKYLSKKLGKRYFEESMDKLYSAILEKEQPND